MDRLAINLAKQVKKNKFANEDQKLDQICKKLSMKDNVYRLGNVKLYVPNYPCDLIQRHIVDKNTFYSQGSLLGNCDKYIKPGAVIIDAGANIGNHSVYWATQCNVSKIISFEPVKETFDILIKNVQLNNLQDKIQASNIGLSDKTTNAKIGFLKNENIGMARVQPDQNGELKLDTLDNLVTEHVDFIKIDVERHEVELLKGAERILTESKPIILVESYPNEYPELHNLLTSKGYVLEEQPSKHDYLYIHKDQERFWGNAK